MSDGEEYHVFVGNLSWLTTDRILEDAFIKFGKIANAKVVCDKYSGRSCGFGFVTFDKKDVIEEAIEKMNGMDLDGRAITVDRAQPGGRRGGGSGSRDRDYDRLDRRNRGGPRGYSSSGGGGGGRSGGGGGGGRSGGGGGGDCFKCGKPGHLARECPSGDGGDIFGGDRYGGGGSGDHYLGHSRDGGGRDRSAPYELPK